MASPSRSIFPDVAGCEFSRSHLLRTLGPVVYAIRLDGGIIKIGHTTDLEDRERTIRRQGNSTTSELLAFLPGTRADEQAIHERLDGHQAHGREYYNPTDEVLAVVNDMRRTLGLEQVAT